MEDKARFAGSHQAKSFRSIDNRRRFGVRNLPPSCVAGAQDELHARCRWWPISLTSLDSARRPETPGRTLADTGENICKPHTERLRVGIEPTTFLLWRTILPPAPLMLAFSHTQVAL